MEVSINNLNLSVTPQNLEMADVQGTTGISGRATRPPEPWHRRSPWLLDRPRDATD